MAELTLPAPIALPEPGAADGLPQGVPLQFPWLSVVIPTYGEKGVTLTRNCVESLRATHAHLMPEVVVISDGDEGDVLEALKALSKELGFRLGLIPRRGFAAACNTGLRHANGQIGVFLVNNDILFETNTLQVLTDAMLTMHAGIVGTRLLYADRTIQHAGVVYVPTGDPELPGYFDHALRGQPENHVDAVVMHQGLVTGALLGISRDFLERSGYLDERYGFTAEDIDLCLRAYECGLPPLYCGYTWAIHLEGASRGRTLEEKRAMQPDLMEKETAALKFLHRKWTGFDLRRFCPDAGGGGE